MKNFFQKNQKGFSILETVVALAIITVGILGVLSLFTQTIRSGELSINQEIAINLAQEGIEVIRNKRDSNWLIQTEPETPWNEGIDIAGHYKVNFSNNIWAIESLGNSDFQPFYLKDNIYTHDSTDDLTIFKRQIYINVIEDILEITSTIQWTDRKSVV